jgi:hypothetical protein
MQFVVKDILMANCAVAGYLVSGVVERMPDNRISRLMLITLQ